MKKVKSMSKSTKIALGSVVIVVLIALIIQYGLKKPSTTNKPIQPIVQQPAPVKVSKSHTTVSVAPVDNRTYSELILAYKDQTLQFGNSCQVHMSKQVYKVGSEVFLDNRSALPVAIKIGSSVYNLSAYGYQVAKLLSTGEFMVDCSDHENVATITVQE